jgi:antitoxin MazE
MNKTVTARVVRIGNSRGIRIPKPLLEQAGITDLVELTVEDGQIHIRARREARTGWAEQFAAMARNGDDRLINGDWPPTRFEDEEWRW